MDTLFFLLSKLAWLFISPDSLLFIWLLLGFIFFWRNKLRLARKVFASWIVVVFLIGLFPVGEWLIFSLEKQHPVNPTLEKVDGIILLGGAEDAVRSHIWKQVVLGNSSERDLAFMRLARKYPNAKKIYTGGSGSVLTQDYKGADVAKQLFIEQGLDTSHIVFERESRNTWENAVLSKKLMKPKADENWVLITSGAHMPRSAGIFCKVGWGVIAYPVSFVSRPDKLYRVEWNLVGNLGRLKAGIREWIGIYAYQFSGKMC